MKLLNHRLINTSPKQSRKFLINPPLLQPPSYLGLVIILTVFILLLGCADVTEAGACWIKRQQNGKCKEIFTRNITKEECCKPGNDDFAYTDKELSEAEYFLATALGDGTLCSSCIDSCDTYKCNPGKKCVMRKGRPKCICAPICKAASKEKRKLRQHIQNYHHNHNRHHHMHNTDTKEASVITIPNVVDTLSLLPSSTSQKNDIRVIGYHDKLQLVNNFESDIFQHQPKSIRNKRMVFHGIKREHEDQNKSQQQLPSSVVSTQVISNHDKIPHQKDTNNFQINHHTHQHNNNHHQHHQHKNQNQQQTSYRNPSHSSVDHLHIPFKFDQTDDDFSLILNSDDVNEFETNDDITKTRTNIDHLTSSMELLQNQRKFSQSQMKNDYIDSNNNNNQKSNKNNHQKNHNNNHPHEHHHIDNQSQQHRKHKTSNRHRNTNRKNIDYMQSMMMTSNEQNSNYMNEKLQRNGQNNYIKANINDDYSQDHYSQFKINNSYHSIKLDKLEKSIQNNQIFNSQNPLEKFIVNYSSNEFQNNNNDNRNNQKHSKNIDNISTDNNNHHEQKQRQHHRQKPKNHRRKNNKHQLQSVQDSTIESRNNGKRRQNSRHHHHQKQRLQSTNQRQHHRQHSNKLITDNFNNNDFLATQKQQQQQQQQNEFIQTIDSFQQFQHGDVQKMKPNNFHRKNDDEKINGNGYVNRSRHNNQSNQQRRKNNGYGMTVTGLTLDEKIRSDYFNNGFSYPQNIDQMVYVNPVCGTDGRTYRSECQLKKRACRQDSTTLTIAYRGYCQTSCKNVKCQQNLTCVEDQYGLPHCIKCNITCPNDENIKRDKSSQVCGYDGQTYDSVCHLNRQVCLTGRSVGVAYDGPCIIGSTCETVSCGPRKTCLKDLVTNQPRCVTCSFKCPRKKYKNQIQNDKYGNLKICGNNNHTYHSWCHMRRDSCNTELYIDIKHIGACHKDSFTTPIPIKPPDPKTDIKPQ